MDAPDVASHVQQTSAALANGPLLRLAGATTAVFVANLYYAQPLAAIIAVDLHVQARLAGGIVSASQFGYALGLLLMVPLSDTVENRRLVLWCSGLVIAALVGLATASSALVFFLCALLSGIFSSGAQILIPFLSRILPAETKGRALGAIMAGVLVTVMLARPFALFVTALAGWRTVYWSAAVAVAALALGLSRTMPTHRPHAAITYARTIGSMFEVYAMNRRVRRRTLYQALIFASFTMFWSTVPIVLADLFGLGLAGIGLFALVGAGGAVTAPVAGRLADEGRARMGMAMALLVLAGAFAGSIWAVENAALALLAVAAVLIDGAVQASQTFSRLVVLEVDPSVRGRVNALYMTLVYTSGAIGSVLGVYVQVSWGWFGVATVGAASALLALGGLLGEPREADQMTA